MRDLEKIAVLKKLVEQGADNFTSREFDIAQNIFRTESDENIIFRLKQYITSAIPDSQNTLLLNIYKGNLDRAANKRFRLSPFIQSRQIQTNDHNDDGPHIKHKLNVQSADQFFDLLFHEYIFSTDGNETLINHHAFFIALVSLSTDTDPEKFFTALREALKLPAGHPLTEAADTIGRETYSSYAAIYHAIFTNDLSDPAMIHEIIQRLQTYTPTPDGYREARDNHLQKYHRTVKTEPAATERHAEFPQTETAQEQTTHVSAPATPRASENQSKSQQSETKGLIASFRSIFSWSTEKKQPKWISNIINNTSTLADETAFFDFLFPKNDVCVGLTNQERSEREKLYRALMEGLKSCFITKEHTIITSKKKLGDDVIRTAIRAFHIKAAEIQTTDEKKAMWIQLGESILQTLSQDPKDRPEAIADIIDSLKHHGFNTRNNITFSNSNAAIKGYNFARCSLNNETLTHYVSSDPRRDTSNTKQHLAPTETKSNTKIDTSLSGIIRMQQEAATKANTAEPNSDDSDLDDDATERSFEGLTHENFRRSDSVDSLASPTENENSPTQLSKHRAITTSASTPLTPSANASDLGDEIHSEDLNSAKAPPPTPIDTNPNKNPRACAATTTTAHVTPSATPITKELILKTLWGEKLDSEKPGKNSACGKALAVWKNKNLKFNKPTEDNIKFNQDEKDIDIYLTVKFDENKHHSLTLNRKVDEKNQTQTWTCETTDQALTLKMQYQLIAAESLSLRIAQGIKNADVISIHDIHDHGDKHKPTSFDSSNTNITLTEHEEMMIKAHLDAGYKSVYYKNCYFGSTTNPGEKKKPNAALPSLFTPAGNPGSALSTPRGMQSDPAARPSTEAERGQLDDFELSL